MDVIANSPTLHNWEHVCGKGYCHEWTTPNVWRLDQFPKAVWELATRSRWELVVVLRALRGLVLRNAYFTVPKNSPSGVIGTGNCFTTLRVFGSSTLTWPEYAVR